ncbi:MAG: c-type cytochrome biogenesis protein CcmI [Burkholderiaceae bacterium]
MSDWLAFSAGAALLCAWAVAGLTAPLWRRRPSSRDAAVAPLSMDTSPGDAALAVLREQWREIDEAHRLGQIDAADWELARRELAQRAALDASPLHHAAVASASVEAGATTPYRGTHQNSGADRRAAVVLSLAVVALAASAYLWHGRPDAQALLAGPWQSAPAPANATQVEAMVLDMSRELEARARSGQSGADEAPAWEMLARALASLQRFDEADRAYRQAIERDPQNARLLADRADVLRAAEGDRPSDEPLRLVQRALRIDPQQPKALALAGRIAYEQRDWRGAIEHWQRAQSVAPAGSDLALGLERGIAQAQQQLPERAQDPRQAPKPLLGAPQPARSSTAVVAGRVELSAALRSQARPEDTVFIVARATAAAMPAGAPAPRMPVAIVRMRVADLPARFELDDRQAMSPDMRPSQFSELSISARVARSGEAMPSAGDWVSDAVTVRRGERGVHDVALRIERVQR